ncbi:hypothetical protein, conserved [Leishmania tarentolae]|uniref:Gamma-butyrobetaine hydroxylase-like N-terminal domain-containing protein n=1 Tax=Leishmania tarentolae TaxID=5689 RepID=A0A640KFA6_LEITA|nr:hypothetical protein, conserved [Leishmania tarentolae]
MNSAKQVARAVAEVAPPSCVRRRRTAASASPRFTLFPFHAVCALATSRRLFTSSLLSKVGDAVASKVSQLADNVWLADEKLVTEPRRRFEPQRASHMSLAERLAAQRRVRQRLVPTRVTVDKSRQYVELTWPEDAVEVMRGVSLEADASDTAEPHRTASSKALSRPAPTSAVSSVSEGAAASLPVPQRATDSDEGVPAQELGSTPSPAPRSPRILSNMPLTTRALAEYLRAYTPSTDGALCGKDIIIYGRRGITITQIIPVGNYALRFVFSDGHSGGIYSYEYLYYLTGPSTKYGLMRGYITELRQRRKSRDPPKRARSIKYGKMIAQSAATAPKP